MTNKKNRRFGLLFALICLAASYYFKNDAILRLFFLISSFSFLLLSILIPVALKKPLKIWNKLGFALGKIFSPIILGSIFLLIFTPVAVILKIIKRDELGLSFMKKKSFWKKSYNNKVTSSSLRDQF